MSYNIEDENVPHEANVADAIDDQMARTSSQAAIPDLASPGSSYVQAEAVAARDKINLILKVLRDAELIPSS
jgi:hypothetical protein